MKFVLPILGLLLGGGAGATAAFLTIDPEQLDLSEDMAETTQDPSAEPDIAPISNQFVVPLIEQDRVTGMVILSLSLEVEPGTASTVFERQPKLRDLALRVLFDHAYLGGFSGNFTSSHNLKLLRTSLMDGLRNELGSSLRGILITDIARQDI
jgi:hypothetical protein